MDNIIHMDLRKAIRQSEQYHLLSKTLLTIWYMSKAEPLPWAELPNKGVMPIPMKDRHIKLRYLPIEFASTKSHNRNGRLSWEQILLILKVVSGPLSKSVGMHVGNLLPDLMQ